MRIILYTTSVTTSTLTFLATQILRTKTALNEIDGRGIVTFLLLCFVILLGMLVGWIATMFAEPKAAEKNKKDVKYV